MGAEIKSSPGNGLYSFRIYDKIYHFVSLLYPNDKNRPGYGHLYIFDTAQEKKPVLKSNQTKGVWPK
jgi:hypothetical protein